MRKILFAGIELTSQRVRGYMVPLSYGASDVHHLVVLLILLQVLKTVLPLLTAAVSLVISVVCMYVCMYVCIFIKLHITAQSGPVIRVILCHSH